LPRDEFIECWSFVRRRGVKTTPGDGLMEGMCPNCGATLAVNQSARCGHCECLVRSGQFDWVLAEITQASVWRAESEAGIGGLAALAARDPGFNVQMLEDHASVAFWRKCAADRAGTAAPLTRLATEELCTRTQATFDAAPKGERSYTGDCAVGSVRTLGFLLGAQRDRALVEVVWDGRRATVEASGKRRLDEERRLRRTLFVLARAAGATTRLDEAFTTATCRTCGAHDLGGTDPACPYCGAPRTGDRSTWLLAEVHEAGSREAADLLGQLRSVEPAPRSQGERVGVGPSAAGLVIWAAALARSDRDVDERERATLHRLAARLELPPERVDEFLDERNDGTGPVPRDPTEARDWYAALVELALADGSISRAERGFLRHAADRLGMSHRESERALAEARGKLYRDSREARRLAR
jgi:tellurite resistance protein